MKQPGSLAVAALSVALSGGVVVAVVPPAAASAGPGIITTLAGGPGRGTVWNTSVWPESVATGPGGAIYVADNGGVVREFTGTSVSVHVTAGNAAFTAEPLGNGVPATRVPLGNVDGVVIDSAGNQVIADAANRIRVVAAATGTFYGRAMTAGDIYTIAGTGSSSSGSDVGDGGPATSAQLQDPVRVALDGSGNVLIADHFDYRVRVVAVHTGTFYGQAMKAGDIYTIAGDGTDAYSGDGGPATSAGVGGPYGIAVDSAGNVLLTDGAGDRVRVVAVRTGTFYGQSMTAGDIYTIAGDGTSGYSGDGGPATAAELTSPLGLATDGAGNVLIADTYNDRVRVVAARSGTFYGRAMTAGDIYTVAGSSRIHYGGDGGPATSAGLRDPGAVTVDAAGNLVIADTQDARVRVVAASTGTFYRRAMTAGDIYTVAGNGYVESSGSGGPAVNAELSRPAGVAVSGSGYDVMSGGDRVWVTAARSGTFFGQAMTAGDIYPIAGDGKYGFWGDRGPGTSAALYSPAGVAVDAAGNVLIADQFNNRVRVVASRSGSSYGQAMAAGHIYTVAGGGGSSADGVPATTAALPPPSSVAVDAAGNLLLDSDLSQVRVVAARSGTFYGQAMTAGDIYTIAGTGAFGYSGDGGPAISAKLWNPNGLAVDGAGNILIADTRNYRVRVVAAASGTFYGQAMTAGDIYTIAGGGSSAPNGVPATSAGIDPEGLALDGSGNVVITDGQSISVVADASGPFYGQAMTAGDIYTIAGGGPGQLGDGGPATSASLGNPSAVAVTGAGDVLIADNLNNRVRAVTP